MKSKRLLAVLLSALMVFSTMSIAVFADNAPELPVAVVSPVQDDNAPNLTFSRNFKAAAISDEQAEYYGDWYADFVLEVSEDVVFNANGNADGYLAGQYDAWSDAWVCVPFEDVTVKKGEAFKIMEYAADALNQAGLKITCADVYNFIKDFDCGVYVDDEFLAAHPDFVISLDLRIYNPENEDENYSIVDLGDFNIIATIAGKNFGTIGEAIAAAQDGDTIVLQDNAYLENANIKKDITIDLNGKTLEINAVGMLDASSGANAAVQVWNDVVIKNGKIDVVCGDKINNGMFYVATTGVLTLDNVDFAAANATKEFSLAAVATNGTPVFVICEPGELIIVDSKLDVTGAGKLFEGAGNAKVELDNTDIKVADSDRVLVNINIDAKDSSFAVNNINDNAFRNLSGTLENTNISANGYENGLKNDSGLKLDVVGDSQLTFTGGSASDITLASGAELSIDSNAKVEADTTDIADGAVVGGEVISKADVIYVQYKKVDVDANDNDTVEGSDEYEIVLVGADDEIINELASADLTFVFEGTAVTGGNMTYTVLPAEGVTLTQLGNRYMFNYNGVTKYEESGAAIVIGTITIDGYGSYTLKTDDSADNKNAVYATEIKDNIVDGFLPAAGLVINTDMAANDGMVGKITDGDIAIPTRTLKITVDFPNAVEDNAIAYQDMKVEITGNFGGVNKTVTYNLGDDEVAMAGGSYVVEDANLILHNAYTVTVSGAGYRTARYTVTMTDDKQLNFWNNVMDEAQVVEIGKDSSKANVTFLAGDIVKDSQINIYDLSAVVSYFGTENVVDAASDYAKYDLNRDGVIDSKDVAYVLVSWGK